MEGDYLVVPLDGRGLPRGCWANLEVTLDGGSIPESDTILRGIQPRSGTGRRLIRQWN